MKRKRWKIATKELGLSEQELNNYSVLNAVRSLYDPTGHKAAFERDVSNQICKRDNRETKGIIIPQEILDQGYASYMPRSGHILTDQVVWGERPLGNRRDAMVKRGMIAGAKAQGGYLVDEELRTLIEVLVENTLALQNVPVLNVEGSPINIPGQASRANIQLTREAPVKFSSIRFSAETTQAGVDALTNAAFALITDTGKKYLAFKSPSATNLDRLKMLHSEDTIGVGEVSFTVQGAYDESDNRIEVNSDAVSTGFTAGSSYALVSPNNVTESTLTFSNISFEPKFLRVQVHLSRTLALLASTDVEMFTRNDIAIGISKAMDTALIYGTGASNQPLGIRNTTGVHTVAWNASDVYQTVVRARRLIAERNIPTNNIKWITSWYLPTEMMINKRLGSQTRRPIMGNDKMLVGAPVEVTSQIPAAGSAQLVEGYLGNWMESALTLWQDLEIEVDPYTLLHQGINRLVACLTMDFKPLRPTAFVRLGG